MGALTATTVNASGAVTLSGVASTDYRVGIAAPTSTTYAAYVTFNSGGGNAFYVGLDNSAGTAIWNTAQPGYAAFLSTSGAHPLLLGTNGVPNLTIASGGAVTLSSTLGVTGDFAVNTSKFTVAASTGNTVVAGTLGVTGAITGSLAGGNSLLLDGGSGNVLNYLQIQQHSTAAQFQLGVSALNTMITGATADSTVFNNTNAKDMIFATNATVRMNILGAGTIVFSREARLQNTTVAGLTAAATAGVGALAFVTDATTTAILGLGLAVTGGGANKVIVYSDGASWLIV